MKTDKDLFLEAYPVSHETQEKLGIYEEMLHHWNEKFNLVADSTLPLTWSRHFLDSAQLLDYIPLSATSVADMGSGAGFPGMVVAVLAAAQKRLLKIHLIEATGKKADFLHLVAEALKIEVTIRRERIEDIRDLKADVIAARALKALPELLKYANYLTHKETVCLFLKGRAVLDELTEARKYWTFSEDIYPSRSDDSGRILLLKDLRYKTRR